VSMRRAFRCLLAFITSRGNRGFKAGKPGPDRFSL
jgi:hypothetical protein